jgi:hypothetical protein
MGFMAFVPASATPPDSNDINDIIAVIDITRTLARSTLFARQILRFAQDDKVL